MRLNAFPSLAIGLQILTSATVRQEGFKFAKLRLDFRFCIEDWVTNGFRIRHFEGGDELRRRRVEERLERVAG